MDSSDHASNKGKAKTEVEGAPTSKKSKAESETRLPHRRKARILLGVCGASNAVKFEHVGYLAEWARVKAVVTEDSLHFINKNTFPMDVAIYGEDGDWAVQQGPNNDRVHYSDLCKWADIMVIAPISPATIAKIAENNGRIRLCDNILTLIVSQWDFKKKPILVAPYMNSSAWRSPIIEKYFSDIEKLGITVMVPLPPARVDSGCKMAETSTISSIVRDRYHEHYKFLAIQLYLDPALESHILKAWNTLDQIEMEQRPSITLLTAPSLEPSKLESLLKVFASKLEPLPVSFASISAFSDHDDNHNSDLLFLAATPTVALLNFQAQLCEAIQQEGIEIGDEYLLNRWIPYCPVAQLVPECRMEEAFAVMRQLDLPVSGNGVEIALVQLSPFTQHLSFVLGNKVD